jgi:hypothetical protein
MKHIFLPLIFLCSVELNAQVGIGTNTPLSKLHVLGNASPIARIENYTLNTPSEILQLSFNNISFPASNDKFITFRDASGEIGAIRGSGINSAPQLSRHSLRKNEVLSFIQRPGVYFESSGADYAEYIPKKNGSEKITAGDIVGVSEGLSSLNTSKADRCMIVSMKPVVVGNSPGPDVTGYALVSFIGQVYVNVVGPVKSGEYIIPSGRNDGTGIAISSNQISNSNFQSVVGQAWETSEQTEKRLVKVGITAFATPNSNNKETADRLKIAESQISVLQEQLKKLEGKIGSK